MAVGAASCAAPLRDGVQRDRLIIGGYSEAFRDGEALPGYPVPFDSFIQSTRTVAQFVDHVLSGKAVIPHQFKGNTRRNNTFRSTQTVALDLESDAGSVSVAHAQASAFNRNHAILIHATRSSGRVIPNHNDRGYLRSRFYGRFSEPVEGFERAQALFQAVGIASGLPLDRASFKPAQPWYGSTNRVEAPYINLEAQPVDVWWVAGFLVDIARAEMERDLAPKLPTIKPTQPEHFSWLERRAAGRLDRALDKMAQARPSERHDTLVGQAYWLAGNEKGGWAVQGWQESLRQVALGVMGESRLGEINRAIRDAEGSAAAIPLELQAPRPQTPDLRIVKRLSPSQASPYYHDQGVPTSWLKAIFKAFPGQKNVPKLLLLYSEALRSGLINPLDYTKGQLLAARTALNIALPDSSLIRALDLTEGLFSFLIIDKKTMPKNEFNSHRGRPEQHFALLTLDEIEHNLPLWAEKRIEEARHRERGTVPNLNDTMIDALEGDARRAAQAVASQLPPASDQVRTSAWLGRKHVGELARSLKDLRNVAIPLDCADVRAALFAAENDPNEGKSNIEIKREYGISKGSIPVLIKRAGLQAEVQVVDCPITSPATFEREVFEARRTYRGFPRVLIEQKPGGAVTEHYYNPADNEANRQIVEAAQQAGSTVRLRLQTANKYRQAEYPMQEQPERKPHARAVSYHEPSEIHPYYGVGYNPSIVLHWLKIHLRRLKWNELPDGRFIDPCGELFDLSEPPPSCSPVDSLIAFAESLGAVVSVIA